MCQILFACVWVCNFKCRLLCVPVCFYPDNGLYSMHLAWFVWWYIPYDIRKVWTCFAMWYRRYFGEAVTRQDCLTLFTYKSDEESNAKIQSDGDEEELFIEGCNSKWSLDVYGCQATTYCINNMLYRCGAFCFITVFFPLLLNLLLCYIMWSCFALMQDLFMSNIVVCIHQAVLRSKTKNIKK